MKPAKILLPIYLSVLGLPSIAMASACEHDSDYEYAQQLRAQKAFADAKPLLLAVITRDPQCMAAKMDLALTHFSLAEYNRAEILLLELRSAAMNVPNHQAMLNIVRTIDAHLREIPLLRHDSELRSASQQMQWGQKPPPLQFAVGLGGGDNINGGVHFDELTFDIGSTTFTKVLDEDSKAQSGRFVDVEAAYQRALPNSSELDGSFQVMAAVRDNHLGSAYDLGTLRGGLELKPGDMAADLNPSIVLSGGSFFLGGEHYRQDMAIGAQIHPTVADRQSKLSYQFTDSSYKTVAETDAIFHKINLSIPLVSNWTDKKVGVGLSVSHQWPQSAERLSDYRETSARLQTEFVPKDGHTVSASYGVSQQRDADVYNSLTFGEKKRNLEQQVLDIGWAWSVGEGVSYEARVMSRQTDSAIPLFENSSIELSAGVRWELD